MSNQHALLPNSELHVPKDFEPAVTGTQAWKDERDQYSWETRFELPPVLNIVDNTLAPPTEVDGDIYIIDATGASHADWDGATANSWVRFSLADDAWNEVEEATGMFVYDKSSGDYYFFDSSAWVAFGGGVGSSSFIGLTDTPANYTSAANKFVRVNAGATATEFVAASAINISTFNNDSGFTADQTSIVGITGTKAQFDTALTDGNFMYIGDAPTAHTHLLSAGATDVTATAAELNLLDLAGLTAGWVLSADTATTASWKAPAGGDTGNILDTGGLTATANRTHTINDNRSVKFQSEAVTPLNVLTMKRGTLDASHVGIRNSDPSGAALVVGGTGVNDGNGQILVQGDYSGGGGGLRILNTAVTDGNWRILAKLESNLFPQLDFIANDHAKSGSLRFSGSATSGNNYMAIEVDNTFVARYYGDARVGFNVAAAASTTVHIEAPTGFYPLRADTDTINNVFYVHPSGKTFVRIPTTTAASINLPHGVAPTSPVNGDMWTTTSSIFARINGATVDLGGGGADGNGIYDGSGTVPTATTTTLTDQWTLTGGTVGLGVAAAPGTVMYVKANSAIHALRVDGFGDTLSLHVNDAGRVGMNRISTANVLEIQGQDADDGIYYYSDTNSQRARIGHNANGAVVWLRDAAQVVNFSYMDDKLGIGSAFTSGASILARVHLVGGASGNEATPLRVDSNSINNALTVASDANVSMARNLSLGTTNAAIGIGIAVDGTKGLLIKRTSGDMIDIKDYAGTTSVFRITGGGTSDLFMVSGATTRVAWGTPATTGGILSIKASGAFGLNLEGSTGGTTLYHKATGEVAIGQSGTGNAHLTLAGGTTARAALQVGNGVAPTTPADGQIWRVGSDLFIRLGGVTETFALV